MNKPTDAEILAFAVEKGMRVRTGKGVVSFARAVLAKWGQPAHSGEPVAWMRDWDVYDPTNSGPEFSHTKKERSKGWVPLYTAPPPVEWEPLTREQVKAICVESGYETATLQERADFINGMMHAERHHGIKGGQHGDAKP